MSQAPASSSPETERLIAASAYLLFFIPMLIRRDSAFAMFHAKQGLVLLIATVVSKIVVSALTFILIGYLLWPLLYLAVAVLWIIGVANALSGKQLPLPLIGQYSKHLTF